MLTANLTSQPPKSRVNRIVCERPSSATPAARTLRRGRVVVVLALVALSAVGLAKVLLDDQPSGTSLGDYDEAVRSAVETLAASDGVAGIQSGYVDGHLTGAVWFDSRNNGDVVVVQRQVGDVGGYGWPGDPTTDPTAAEQVITTTIWVRVDDRQYQATLTDGQPDDGWSVTEANDGSGAPLALGLILLFQYEELATPTEVGEVSFEGSVEGGGVWTLKAPFSDGDQITIWQIGGAGELVSWSYELVGVSSSNLEFPGLTSGAIQFTPLIDPDPIFVPDPQAIPDPAKFGLPGDFPLGSG